MIGNQDLGPLDLTSCSLCRFAAVVHAVIAQLGATAGERFGARKVYISAIYTAAMLTDHEVGELDTFKARLIAANRAGLLDLARADLIAAMDPEAVEVSEIHHLTSTFHFVLDRSACEPWEIEASLAEVA